MYRVAPQWKVQTNKCWYMEVLKWVQISSRDVLMLTPEGYIQVDEMAMSSLPDPRFVNSRLNQYDLVIVDSGNICERSCTRIEEKLQEINNLHTLSNLEVTSQK